MLESLVTEMKPDAATIRKLCKLASRDDGAFAVSTTWVLKRFFENGKRFTQSQSDQVLKLGIDTDRWEAQLHVLQTLPGLQISETLRFDLRRWFLKAIEGDNKLLRAWSYNAMAILASQYAEFEKETEQLLRAGEQDPVASVRARIRNIRKTRPSSDGDAT